MGPYLQHYEDNNSVFETYGIWRISPVCEPKGASVIGGAGAVFSRGIWLNLY